MRHDQKILAIGAHHDDVELGCGGSLLKWGSLGHEITVLTASRSGYCDAQGHTIRSNAIAREEGRKAADFMGAKLIEGGFETFALEFSEPLNCLILEALECIRPDIVLTHWSGDVHHDHQAVALSTLHCCRHVPRILMYRSNWYSSDRTFQARFLVDISKTFEQKRTLIDIYASERRRTGALWEQYIASQSRWLGHQAGVSYAEGFEVVKWLE
jgi:LmbE family N-acetylglucosaminyl deacetylase